MKKPSKPGGEDRLKQMAVLRILRHARAAEPVGISRQPMIDNVKKCVGAGLVEGVGKDAPGGKSTILKLTERGKAELAVLEGLFPSMPDAAARAAAGRKSGAWNREAEGAVSNVVRDEIDQPIQHFGSAGSVDPREVN